MENVINKNIKMCKFLSLILFLNICFFCSCKQNIVLFRPITPRFIFIGTIGPKDSLTFQVIIKNINDQPLKITKMNTSCGCMVTQSIFPITINARSIDSITILYKPFYLNDTGQVEKYLAILSNSDTAISNITVRGYIMKF